MTAASKTGQKDEPSTEEPKPMTESFKLTKADIPGRQVRSVYTDIISEFRAGGENTVLVELAGVKPQTLRSGLRSALKHEGTDDVRQVQRGESTYLVRHAQS